MKCKHDVGFCSGDCLLNPQDYQKYRIISASTDIELSVDPEIINYIEDCKPVDASEKH